MKRTLLFGFAFVWTIAAHAQGLTNTVGDLSSRYELLKTPVLKVYATQDGATTFRAYAVKWHDAEVIASDRLGATSFNEGETVDVMVLRHEINQMHMLSFDVVAVPRAK